MSGVLRDGRESGLYQYISKLNIEGSATTCAYVSSHPVALHWASISTLPFLKLAKMISVLLSREKKEKKRLHFVPFFHSSIRGKWDPTCSSSADAGVTVRARSIEAGRGGRPGPWEKGERRDCEESRLG